MKDRFYFESRDGKRYYYDTLAEAIRREHPQLVGAHIFEQLDALGLRFAFRGGKTPFPLPRSFTD